jgi:hypothetical protein
MTRELASDTLDATPTASVILKESPTPRPPPTGVLEIVNPEVSVDRSELCSPVSRDHLEHAELYQLTMPFDVSACWDIERFFDIRQVEQGAGVYVPVHTARLKPGVRISAPVSGHISIRKMQQDTAPGLHLYGAGTLWIRIQPTDPTGRSVPENPVVHLYVPSDSIIATRYEHLPRQSNNVEIERQTVVVEALGSNLLDPERTHNHNLIMFLETGRGFIELFSEGTENFLVTGSPRI